MDNFQCGEDYQVVDVIGTSFFIVAALVADERARL